MSDFCIAVPHDRFLEVRGKDRDRYNYRHKFARISWSGIELSSLLRKRLAILRNVSDTKGPALEERLSNIMKRGYPELPNEIIFQFNGIPYRLPLFIYVLRHSFWRPRDILFYYATLLAASEPFLKYKKDISSDFIRQVISGSTHQILEDEFYEEFVGSFRNLRQVMQLFRHNRQVLSWAKLKEILDDVRFDTNLSSDQSHLLEWKVELLYDIGALGVILDRKTAQKLQSFRHAFSFNEGRLLTDKLGREDYSKFQFVLHPVFCESLHLDTSENQELILPFDWNYLYENERLRLITSL